MKVSSITKLRDLNDTSAVMRVEFDDSSQALMIYDYGEALKFIDKEVIVSFRDDLYDGIIQRFINTLTETVTVNTLDKSRNIKLYTDVPDGHSNVTFRDIDVGDISLNAIVYCSDMSFGSSPRAVWCDIVAVDRMRKIANIRLFDPDNKASEFIGKYIKCDLRKTQYGFNTQHIEAVDNQFPVNPEVDIAQAYIMDVFADDEEMLKVISDSDLLTYLKRHVDYEPGYLMVRLAVELSIANELTNLMKEVDMRAVMRALLCSKMFVKNTDSIYSKSFINMVNTSHYKFSDSKSTLILLDESNQTESPERTIYKSIINLGDNVIKAKKGLLAK